MLGLEISKLKLIFNFNFIDWNSKIKVGNSYLTVGKINNKNWNSTIKVGNSNFNAGNFNFKVEIIKKNFYKVVLLCLCK